MVKLRSQDDDLKGKGVDSGESIEERLSRLEEINNQRFSKLEEMFAALMKQNQPVQRETEERSTLDRSATSSMKMKGGGSDHFERFEDDRRFRDYLMLRSDDDDETWTEHYSVMDDETDSWEEEAMPQFQVPVSDLEHGLRIHNASSIVCEDSQYVVGCGELCDHQKSILQVSYVKEVEELPQKSTSGNGEHVAHQLFDQKPVRVTHKEKHMKHLKAWRFKFKPTSKRNKLMDDMFSFVEETALLKKDPKETIWDCVKKEFKETMAACGKTRVVRFKLIEEIGSSATNNVQVTEWIHGEEPEKGRKWKDVKLSGSLQSYYDDQGKSAELVMRDQTQEIRSYVVYSPWVSVQRDGAVETQTCISRRANHVWKPGGFVHPEIQLDWLERADSNHEKEGNKKLRNVEDGVKQDKNRFSGDVGAKIFMALEELHLLQVMRNTKLKFFKRWWFKYKCVKEGIQRLQILLRYKSRSVSEGWFKIWSRESWRKQKEIQQFTMETEEEMEDMMEEDLKQQQGDSEPLVTVPDLDAKPTLRISMWDIQKRLNQYMVMLLTPVAYATHFSGGVGMDKKQSFLSLRNNRVWDPGG